MVFSGSLNKPATVTVGGNAATVDVNNNFRGTAAVTTGTNTVPVIATDAYSHVTTNRYQVVIPPASSAYTYDLNGNLTYDGSRTFAWDAKNQLVKITYADTSYFQFTYNGAGERVKIQEYDNTGSHNLTSTKQYVWAGGLAEERDANNTVTKRYFGQGEQRVVGGTTTNYFYTRDHLGSIREMIDASGAIQARYSYDPYGRRTKVSGALDCDFGFTGHYWHATSSLYLASYRAYDPNLGRWISRDPSGEGSGLNLYTYCGNNPICEIDLIGLVSISITDADLNAEMTWMDLKINGDNISGVPVSRMSRSQFLAFMLKTDEPNSYGSKNAEADTSFHGSPFSYTYSGSAFPELNGLTLTGHELNYMGVGAAIAAAGYPIWFSELVTKMYYYDAHNHASPSPGVYAAMDAGWWDYFAHGDTGRFAFPPSSCMEVPPLTL